MSGRPISSIICTNPWAGPCNDENCFVCSTGGSGPCGRTGCNYTVQCVTCRESGPAMVPRYEENEGDKRPGQGPCQGVVGQPAVANYYGESGATRGLDHSQDLTKRNPSNALWRHCQLYHNSEPAQFSMSVTATAKKPYIRRIREGVEITSGKEDILLNSKSEFLQGYVPHTRVPRGFGS